MRMNACASPVGAGDAQCASGAGGAGGVCRRDIWKGPIPFFFEKIRDSQKKLGAKKNSLGKVKIPPWLYSLT